MSTRSIDYGNLVERALRQVVRSALAQVASHGVPAKHQLYVTFRTNHQGVVLSDHLHARYPSEMTIVLEHEFWDLQVDDDRFAVTLSFSETPERLEIPFEAVTVFADPGVEFGLQFTGDEGGGGAVEATPLPPPKPSSDASGPRPGESAEVVTLDRFRKK
jgi:hypothetical protein